MGSSPDNVALCIKHDENILEVCNCSETKPNEHFHVFNFSDLFTNNIVIRLSTVSILRLENCGISEFPNSFQQLNLRHLCLSRNKICEVPSCLYSRFKSLELLDLSYNLLKSFDIELGCSQSVVTLKLGNNKIWNFPFWVVTLPCPRLVELDYTHNCIVQIKPIRRLGLKKLIMINTQLVNSDLSFLKQLELLEYLDVSNDGSNRNPNRISDIDFLFVKTKWKYLKILILNNLLVSILPTHLFYINSLTELHLVNCALSWIPEHVELLKNLEFLDITRNSICSLGTQLSSLPKLKIVKAPFNQISSVAQFVNNLDVIDLYSNYLEDIPNCVEQAQFIDLELNLVDTTLYTNYLSYESKKDNLRRKFGKERSDGCKIRPPSVEDIDDIKSVFSDENYDACERGIYESNSDSECWDDEKPVSSISPNNPEVTTSDNEWDAGEEPKMCPSKKKILLYDPNEDWIFCDVE